jgi:hypothetical protein
MQMTKSFSIENIKSRMLTFAQICDSFASAKLTYMYIYAFSLYLVIGKINITKI